MITYCDVIPNCTDCPRYGDDCDGSTERLYTHKEAWGMTDLIRREDAIAYIERVINSGLGRSKSLDYIHKYISALPSSDAEWIPCSERLPEDIKPVIVTWKNNDPKSYYQYIVGKHFIGTAHYLNGKWFWYSSTTEDLLAEYGRCDGEEFDEAIEVVAWMPLPEPYREDGEA